LVSFFIVSFVTVINVLIVLEADFELLLTQDCEANLRKRISDHAIVVYAIPSISI
jgi:hypothetical protein